MLLIRYMPLDYGLKSIMSGEFKVARPCDVNDPYEMMGACKGELKSHVKKELRDDVIYDWITQDLKITAKRGLCSIEELENHIDSHPYYFRRILMGRLVQQNLCRVLCFIDANKITEVTDQLMWGHYAYGGSGIRAWFDSEVLQAKGMPTVVPVKYGDQRPLLDLSALDSYKDLSAWESFLRDVWFTKSRAWEYEHEWRMLFTHIEAADFLSEKGGIEYVTIPSSAVVRVDFGPKGIIGDTRDFVDKLRSNEATKHIEFRVATFAEDAYNYEYIEYEKVRRLI